MESPQKKQTNLPPVPAILLLGIYSREMKINIYAKLIHKCSREHYFYVSQSVNKCPSTGINIVWSTYTMEYYSAIKREEVLIYVNTDDLESIMPSQRGQTLKATHYMILFIANIQNKQILRQKVDSWLSGAGEDGKEEMGDDSSWV